MSTTKMIITALFSLLAWTGAYSQDVMKAKRKPFGNCKEPMTKVKEKDGIVEVTSKDHDGYHKIKRQYYYDHDVQLYYYMSGGHRLYYDSDWKPF